MSWDAEVNKFPNGRLLNSHLPDRVMNVIWRELSSDNGIFQKTEVAYGFVNTLAVASIVLQQGGYVFLATPTFLDESNCCNSSPCVQQSLTPPGQRYPTSQIFGHT